MAITVQHAPNMNLLARSGYWAGAGAYRQQQRDMAMRERMQQRAMDYNLLSQEIAHNNAMQRQAVAGQQNAMAQQIQHQAGMQRALQLQNNQQDFQREMAQMEREDRLDQFQNQLKAQNERIMLTGQSFQERDMVQHLLGQADTHQEMIGQMLQDGMGYTPEDQAKAQQIRKNVQAIATDQTLTPMARANAIYEQTQRMPVPTERIPTKMEEFQAQTIMFDDPNRSGIKLPLAQNRNGEWQVVQGYKSPELQEDEPEDPKLSPSFNSLPATDRAKIYLDTLKALTRTESGAEGGSQTVFPKDDEIMQRIKAMGIFDGEEDETQQQPAVQPAEVPAIDGMPQLLDMFDDVTGFPG